MWGRTRSAPRGNDRFTARRRLRRRRAVIGASIFSLFLLAGAVYGVNQNFARIASVQVFGADDSLASMATSVMQGRYLGLIPRDSILFFPGSQIRADILKAHPDYAAVSLFRSGFTSLSIRVNERVPVARWCGDAPTSMARFNLATSSPSDFNPIGCYYFDANGLLYATTTESQPINSFLLYEPLAPSTSAVIGTTLPHAEIFPSTFDFARELATFGTPVIAIGVRSGEVDDYLASGTRVTYVLGSEQAAFTALESARANLNLASGSLEYVDLRFDGKVYIKARK